jgi:UDPglucose 6-dehydrogenase
VKGKRFCMWGLAFKPKTDDMREAPSVVVAEALTKKGAVICTFDPEAMKEARRTLGNKVEYADSAMAAARGADALLLITEWSEFRQIDLDDLKSTMKQPLLFDGRNIWDAERVRARGFTYYGIGVK